MSTKKKCLLLSNLKFVPWSELERLIKLFDMRTERNKDLMFSI